MKNAIIAIVLMSITTASSITSAQPSSQPKKITWFLRTEFKATGVAQSYPPDADTDILLPTELAKEWECKILHSDPAKDGSKFRQLACFHKDQQGYYSSMLSNSSQCYLDGTKRGTEIGHLTIAAIIPDATHNPNNMKLVLMDLDLYCSIK